MMYDTYDRYDTWCIVHNMHNVYIIIQDVYAKMFMVTYVSF